MLQSRQGAKIVTKLLIPEKYGEDTQKKPSENQLDQLRKGKDI